MFFICCLSTLMAVDVFFSLTSAAVNSTGEDICSLRINNCLPLGLPAVFNVALLNCLPPVVFPLQVLIPDIACVATESTLLLIMWHFVCRLPQQIASHMRMLSHFPSSQIHSVCSFFPPSSSPPPVCFTHRSARCSETRSSLQCGSRWG